MSSFLRRYVFHNFGLKLLSLAAAVVLWSLMATEPELETTISVPVEFHNTPKDLEMISDQDSNVHLQVKGAPSKLRTINHSDVAVVLDLISVQQPGARSFALDGSRVLLPRGVTLVKSMPSQVRFVFEPRSARAVPVLPRFSGRHEPGYEIASYTVVPPSLVVVGPESRVAVLEHVITDPIPITGVTGSASFGTNAYLPDPQL